MKCTKCKNGEVKVYLHGETQTIYKETPSGWVKGRAKILGYNLLYARCEKCGEEYFVNEHKFYEQGKIEVYMTNIKVLITMDENGMGLALVAYENNEELFKLLEFLGWVVDKGMEGFPPISSEWFEKHFASPKGKGMFGGLDKDESIALLAKTEEALSRNNIPYSTKVRTLADLL